MSQKVRDEYQKELWSISGWKYENKDDTKPSLFPKKVLKKELPTSKIQTEYQSQWHKMTWQMLLKLCVIVPEHRWKNPPQSCLLNYNREYWYIDWIPEELRWATRMSQKIKEECEHQLEICKLLSFSIVIRNLIQLLYTDDTIHCDNLIWKFDRVNFCLMHDTIGIVKYEQKKVKSHQPYFAFYYNEKIIWRPAQWLFERFCKVEACTESLLNIDGMTSDLCDCVSLFLWFNNPW
jgi:hypothetical protein